MITNDIVNRELGILKRVLSYKGLRKLSIWHCLWPGIMMCLWFALWPLLIFSVKLHFSELVSEERLGLFVSTIAVVILGFFSIVFSFNARSLYLSVPYGFIIYSEMYSFFSKKLRRYVSTFLLWYLLVVVFCALAPFGFVFFTLITIGSVIVLSVCVNIGFNAYKLNAMASIITSFKSVGKTKALRNDDGYESIKLYEHNPATGLPMIGGVDVGGNPYGYSRHE